MKNIDDVRLELFDAFVEENWFYDVRIKKALLEGLYEVELIMNDNFNISNLNDVKDELSYEGFEVYDENYFITKRNVKNTYSVKFFVKGVREWLKGLIDFQVAVW